MNDVALRYLGLLRSKLPNCRNANPNVTSDANLIDGTVVGKGMADPDIKTEVVANLLITVDQQDIVCEWPNSSS